MHLLKIGLWAGSGLFGSWLGWSLFIESSADGSSEAGLSNRESRSIIVRGHHLDHGRLPVRHGASDELWSLQNECTEVALMKKWNETMEFLLQNDVEKALDFFQRSPLGIRSSQFRREVEIVAAGLQRDPERFFDYCVTKRVSALMLAGALERLEDKARQPLLRAMMNDLDSLDRRRLLVLSACAKYLDSDSQTELKSAIRRHAASLACGEPLEAFVLSLKAANPPLVEEALLGIESPAIVAQIKSSVGQKIDHGGSLVGVFAHLASFAGVSERQNALEQYAGSHWLQPDGTAQLVRFCEVASETDSLTAANAWAEAGGAENSCRPLESLINLPVDRSTAVLWRSALRVVAESNSPEVERRASGILDSRSFSGEEIQFLPDSIKHLVRRS